MLRADRASGDRRQSFSQPRIDVERFDPMERQAAAFGLFTGTDLDVVQDLEVVGQELDRRDDDGRRGRRSPAVWRGR